MTAAPATEPAPDPEATPGALGTVAYLVNDYPAVSHTFIRREIQALEQLGWRVERFSVKRPGEPKNDLDAAEFEKTTALLAHGAAGLPGPPLKGLLRGPGAWLDGLADTVRLGYGSDRGLLRNMAYFAEANLLLQHMRERGVTHVHAHFATNPAMVAMLAKRLSEADDQPITYSFVVHGPEDFDRPKALRLDAKVKHASFVTVISSFTRGQMFRWADHADWDRIHVVHCGLDDGFLDEAATSGPVPDVPRLCCIGRLCEQKGQQLLVEAAGLLRERGVLFELDLIGDGPMRPEVEQAIAEQGVEGLVNITGYVSSDEVRRRLTGSRAMVLGSFAEGLPVVLMEALSVGRPVVSTFLAGIPELVTPEVGWLVPMGDAALLADAMETVLKTPAEELTRMGEAGRRRVRARHRALTEAQKLSRLLLQAMGRDGEAEAFAASLRLEQAGAETAAGAGA